MEKGSSQVTISQEQTLQRRVTGSNEAVRQFLVEAGEVYGRQITSALVSIWQRELTHIAEPALINAMHKTFLECRFFPTIADVMQRVRLEERTAEMIRILRSFENTENVERGIARSRAGFGRTRD